MNKITFANGQPPYINATNLNTMQNNIETAIDEKSSLPQGGTTGQILAKKSNADNDVEWVENQGGGGGGRVVSDTLPIGAIIPYSSDTIPSNWLLCNGQAVSRTTYNKLFEVIGTTYGIGDGSTTFNLPNLKGRVPVGLDGNDTDFDVLGETGGEKTHTLTVEEMPEHNHGLRFCDSNGQYAAVPRGNGTNPDWGSSSNTVSNTGGGQPHNIVQPYMITNYIIKATQLSGSSVSGDTLPIGSVIDYDGDTVPANWEEVSDPNEYSLTEQVVGKWVDGKPLYRKVIDIGNLPNTDYKDVPTGLSNVIVENVYGRAYNSTSKNTIPLPYVSSTTGGVSIAFNNNNIRTITDTDRSVWTGYVILEYTKTTD